LGFDEMEELFTDRVYIQQEVNARTGQLPRTNKQHQLAGPGSGQKGKVFRYIRLATMGVS
jgi:hypothetical protein